MSWGVSVTSKTPDEMFEALSESFANQNPEAAESVKAQFETAKDCVDSLLGVVDGSVFNCSLSGHSFEAGGGVLDYVNVNLAAATQPAVVEPAAE